MRPDERYKKGAMISAAPSVPASAGGSHARSGSGGKDPIISRSGQRHIDAHCVPDFNQRTRIVVADKRSLCQVEGKGREFFSVLKEVPLQNRRVITVNAESVEDLLPATTHGLLSGLLAVSAGWSLAVVHSALAVAVTARAPALAGS